MTQHARTLLRSSPPSALAAPDALGQHDGVSFKRERLAPILRELVPLIEADWRENGVDQDQVPLALNLDRYLDYDLVGILQIVTARDVACDGLLVGFVAVFIHPHIDHKDRGWAILSWYFLYPEYRKRGIGGAMMDAMLGFLKDAKVSVVEASRKVTHPHGVFEKRGFVQTDVVLRKVMEA